MFAFVPPRTQNGPMPEPKTLGQTFTERVDDLSDRLGGVLRWLVLLMVLVGAYNALTRYVAGQFGMQLRSNALNELQWYIFSVIFLLGAAYGLKTDAHVRVDVMYGRLSEKSRAWIDLLGGLLFLLPFSALMLWVSWPAVRRSWAVLETSPDPGGLPRYPIKALILVSFGLLLVQGLAQIARSTAVIRGKAWATSPRVISQSGASRDPDEGPGGVV